MELFLFDDLFGINQIYIDRFFCEALHDAVALGDMDEVEQLLDEPGSDINSVYFGENLLWTAIVNNQSDMARFLIDNGVDTSFSSCQVEIQDQEDRAERKESGKDNNKPGAKSKQIPVAIQPANQQAVKESSVPATVLADVYEKSCRQMAYECELYEIVNLIDYKHGEHPRWLDPPSHEPRLTKSALRKQRQEEELLSLPHITERRAVTIADPPLFTVSLTPDVSRRNSPCKSEILRRGNNHSRLLPSSLSLPEPSLSLSPIPYQYTTIPSAFMRPNPPSQHSSASSFQFNTAHPYRLNKTYIVRAAVTITDRSLNLRHPEKASKPKTQRKPEELVDQYKYDQHCDKSENLVDEIASKISKSVFINESSGVRPSNLLRNRNKRIGCTHSILLRAQAGLRLNERCRKGVRMSMTQRLKQNAALNLQRRIQTVS